MLKLLIAIDGSEASMHAIEAVATMARASVSLDVLLLNVRDGPVYYGELPVFSADEIELAQLKRQDQLLAEATTKVQDCGLTVRASLRAEGLAAPEIVRLAAEHQVDQIVLGTRGMSAIGSLLIGSVAQRVVHLATMPVLLVK
ncbi:universal stress protein [Roseateles oligotrophus]|uniref:Universal stress protein n=1 Tax=Roseateles oligotrophus TaxID=1769250 RepID=A0ABT2YN84_9BURK|nr:universal stress protein [Roseateles oligotrophus]MCV2371350.1 universal stress protein [Roseateles oligotrophus]